MGRSLKTEITNMYKRKNKPGRTSFSSGKDADPVYVKCIDALGSHADFFIERNSADTCTHPQSTRLPEKVDMGFVYIAKVNRVVKIDVTQAQVAAFDSFFGKVMMIDIGLPMIEHEIWPFAVRAWIVTAYYPGGQTWHNTNAPQEEKAFVDEITKKWKERQGEQ